ncbi:type II toxin-antitoxin system VapC family toxin [Methylophaga nitratireducenticrescens]|uniref:PilT protein domain protein n=1 Tax=Methylophaga nitratireducenticrescens TaxID=754476 RepID=I1XMB2_METNJ|nr:PIN domain nuclease [Methylophaga nitratireducenticrescens]AFI85531.1 PIN domain nuclease [Methylophaga nitratireducenticrescens]AUZ85270.1 PIN domain nuclease [Methylophaga nitratireducenticrescens]
MILVDTSVWIDYFNGVQNQHTDTLDAGIVEGTIAMGDLIFLEILQGIRDDRDYRLTKQTLLTLERLEMFGKGMPEKCAENYRALRKKGITIRKTTDVIIASFCIEQRIPLLFLDRDFIPFVEHLGLRSVLPYP